MKIATYLNKVKQSFRGKEINPSDISDSGNRYKAEARQAPEEEEAAPVVIADRISNESRSHSGSSSPSNSSRGEDEDLSRNMAKKKANESKSERSNVRVD